MAENHFDIDRSTHIRTSSANKDFYNLIVDEKKIFAAKHQLYTFAIMVATFKALKQYCEECGLPYEPLEKSWRENRIQEGAV